jgi:hypothetical protein
VSDFQRSGAKLSYGVSIYLHRVEFNTNRRNRPPRISSEGKRYRPPTPMDLHFLVTAWGQSAEQQMEIMGWAIRTLQETPELPAGLLNRFAGERGERIFQDSEGVELVGENLTPQDFVNIWGNSLANQQPSISYVARQVLIDSETEMVEGELVQTRQFDYVKLVSDDSTFATAH